MRTPKATKISESSATKMRAAVMTRMGPPACAAGEKPVSADVFRHIYLLNSVLERLGNRCAEQHALTMPQWLALGCIAFGGESGVTHSELGARLMLSKAPITGVVDRLERDGLVQRTVDGHDRRVSRVAITPAGEEKWYLVRTKLRDCSLDICSGLEEPEQQTLLSLLSRLLDKASHSDPILCAMKQEGTAKTETSKSETARSEKDAK